MDVSADMQNFHPNLGAMDYPAEENNDFTQGDVFPSQNGNLSSGYTL